MAEKTGTRRYSDSEGALAAPPGVTQEEIDFWRSQRQEDIREALEHRAARARWAWTALVIMVALVVGDNRQQASRESRRNEALIERVQQQRAISLFEGCVSQNKRNAATKEEVTREILTRSKGDFAKESALREQAKFTLRLIDALAPRANCFERVERLVAG